VPAGQPGGGAAERVRALRETLGLSQEQLAQQLEVSFATVNRWEGGRHAMSVSVRCRFEALEVAAAGPPATGDPALGGALPDFLSSYVGGDEVITTILELVDRYQLVCLTGPTGVGKTRLAVELCRRRPRGEAIGFVGLSRSDDAQSVPNRVGTALDSGPELVVLDGVDGYVDVLRRLLPPALARRPELRLLVTSQRPIGVSGERCWPVAPLACPAPGADPVEIIRTDAGRLFVDRATARVPEFRLTEGVAEAIAELCRDVDGLPLALETLAEWAAVISIEQIGSRCAQLLLLAGAGVAHDSTLGDGVRSSYDLLAAYDRTLVQCLSTFAGSFTIADAAQVADLAEADLVVALRRLVDCSWLLVEVGDTANTYRMLSALRHFGVGQLGLGSQESKVRTRHAVHFAALAGASEPGLAGVDRADWVARMTRAGVDIDAALAWALDDGDDLLGLAMSRSLWLWWLTTGRLADGRRWLSDFMGRVKNPPTELAARADCAAAVLAVENGDYDAAIAHATRSLKRFMALGDVDGEARAATALGSAHRYLGHHELARQHLELAMNRRSDLGDDRGLAAALNNMALLALDAGDLAATRELFEESLLVKRRLGEPRTVAIGLANLSDVLIRAGLVSAALTLLREAADIAADLADTQLLATIASNLGDAAFTQGEYCDALEHYQSSLDAYRASGGAHDLVPALCGMARALHLLGRTHEAVVRLREAESLSVVNANADHLGEIRATLAEIGYATTIALPGGLTARQAQILGQVADGASNKAIAAALHISVPTVERHLATTYSKLGLHGRVDAARYALKHGLAPMTQAEPDSPSRPEYMIPRIPNGSNRA
jgi:non-specific serine/threonine protein kinase